jgi:osmotically-inducible protein OsmY
MKVGEAIRQMLMQDKKLAPPPSNVIATTHNGVVTLRGTIPTRRTRETLVDRIAQLPGVTQVDDQLKIR